MIFLDGLQSILNINLWGYGINTMADPPGTPRSLEVSYKSLTVADKIYTNVYARYGNPLLE